MQFASLSVPALRLKRHVILVGIAIAATASAAQAQEASKMFSFSGFGTLGYAHSDSTDGDYTANLIQAKGTGRSKSWAPIDTMVAGQLTAKLNDQFSAVVQVVSMQRPEGNYKPEVEWAYVKYAITPQLSIMAGRTVLPSYMVSETRMVGFANPWVRPPIELYNQNPITNLDGVNASYRTNISGFTNTTQIYFGKNEVTVATSTGALLRDIKATHVQGIANTLEFGSWTVRGGLTNLDIALPQGPSFVLHVPAKQRNVGFTYDPGNWFVQGEISTSSIDKLRDTRAGYVTGGWRVGEFTPYITYSKIEQGSKVVAVISDQKSTSVGLRWDFRPRMALKAQFDHVELGPRNVGSFVNVKPAIAGTGSDVASVALDFVF